MAGVYIHIPFCTKACHYCDFHFSTNQEKRTDMVAAITTELILQKNYLQNEKVRTIYFGGGTPSLLSFEEITSLLNVVRDNYDTTGVEEITLEANPDDLTDSKLNALRRAGINRLSIGLQSFQDAILHSLNRTHSAQEGIQSVSRARAAGFTNISVDLIYAIPDVTLSEWDENISQALDLHPEHISAYSLTIEPDTVFGRWASKGKMMAVPDDIAAQQMEMLMTQLQQAGYDHYEISNFAKPGYYSRHNSNYWCQEKYLGVGPSAHSYNNISRQFNISNNHLYLKSIKDGKVPFELDPLSLTDKINEYILTTLRTSKGCDLTKLKVDFNFDLQQAQQTYIEQLRTSGLAVVVNQSLVLTPAGRLLADKISSDLFEYDGEKKNV